MLEPGPRSVLQILADFAGAARNHCWPGAAFIAFKCRRSIPWVRQQIADLKNAGLLLIKQRGFRRTNVYTLLVGAGDMSSPEKVEGQGEFSFLGDPGPVTPVDIAEATTAAHPTEVQADDCQPAAIVTARRLAPDPTTDPTIKPPPSLREVGPQKRRPEGSHLPEDWQPSPADCAFALDLGLLPSATADEFRDYWLAESGQRARKRSWSRAWQTWCRKAVRFASRGRKSRYSAGPLGALEAMGLVDGDQSDLRPAPGMLLQ